LAGVSSPDTTGGELAWTGQDAAKVLANRCLKASISLPLSVELQGLNFEELTQRLQQLCDIGASGCSTNRSRALRAALKTGLRLKRFGLK
jgi:dihydroorotate dehydrogenase